MYNFDLMGYEVPSYALQLRPHASTHIPLATQSVWCGDVADLVEPLYELMAEKVRTSHVVCADDTIMPMLNTGKAVNAKMWVCVCDHGHPYYVFDLR